jgi:hypothetical protein
MQQESVLYNAGLNLPTLVITAMVTSGGLAALYSLKD